MLTELSVVEQRYLAVREALDGAKITDVATRYGVDRRTIHRWLRPLRERGPRRAGGPELAARTAVPTRRRPRSRPGSWRCGGPIPAGAHGRSCAKLRKEIEDPPSRSAIYRCLVRHRLIDPKPRRRRASDYKRWERSRPMELWQMDVMGGVSSKTAPSAR